MPEDLRLAHEHSSKHRDQILASQTCGCFYCCAIFRPSAIEDWVDEEGGVGQTALCPKCGIDSVIGDQSGYPITEEFLTRMNRVWF